MNGNFRSNVMGIYRNMSYNCEQKETVLLTYNVFNVINMYINIVRSNQVSKDIGTDADKRFCLNFKSEINFVTKLSEQMC